MTDPLITDDHTPSNQQAAAATGSGRVDIIERILSSRIPGAQPSDLTVEILEQGGGNSWSATPRGLAGMIHVALLSSESDAADAPTVPTQLQGGDLVHLHYPHALDGAGWGETYMIRPGYTGNGRLDMAVFHQPPVPDDSGLTAPVGYDGAYMVYGAINPLARPLEDLGPANVTVVRHGRVIPNAGS